MASSDNRFEGYNAAPLNQNILDRGARASAGAATGIFTGSLIGALLTPIVVGATAAVAVGAIAFGGVAVLGAIGGLFGVGGIVSAVTASASVIASLATFAGIGAGIAGVLGAPLGGFLGGVVGGVRGATREHSRAGLDQSLYNIAVAESVGRGAAQAQAFVPPQPAVQHAPVVTQPTMREAAPVGAPANDNAAAERHVPSAKTQAGTPIQNDGTINANVALARV